MQSQAQCCVCCLRKYGPWQRSIPRFTLTITQDRVSLACTRRTFTLIPALMALRWRRWQRSALSKQTNKRKNASNVHLNFPPIGVCHRKLGAGSGTILVLKCFSPLDRRRKWFSSFSLAADEVQSPTSLHNNILATANQRVH